jgi:hypothetical protein
VRLLFAAALLVLFGAMAFAYADTTRSLIGGLWITLAVAIAAALRAPVRLRVTGVVVSVFGAAVLTFV